MRFEDPDKLGYRDRVENVRLGGYIPDEHVKDMDLDGVDVGILYPTCGLLLYAVPDNELLTAIFKTYNDWIAEFCQSYPKRFKGIGMINIDDVPSAVRELERCAKMDLGGVMISVYPQEHRSYDSPTNPSGPRPRTWGYPLACTRAPTGRDSIRRSST